MTYLVGILLSFASKAVVSVANIFDSQLSRQTFASVWSLVILNGLLIIPALPVLFFVLRPEAITAGQYLIIAVIALTDVYFQYPYYKALQFSDTSVVVSLFSLEKIFVPILAYFIVSEKLSSSQYIGFGLIIACSLAMTAKKSVFTLNKAVLYMIPVTIILALSSVIEKYGLNQIEWKTFFFWSLALTVPLHLLNLWLIRSARREVRSFLKAPFSKKYIPLYGQNIATWISGGLGTAALSILPVTVHKAISAFQSVMVHLIAAKGANRLRVERELFSGYKLVLFVLTGLGVILTLVR